MQNVYEYKSAALTVEDIDKRQGIVTGYFSQFGNIDLERDVIRKGAFARTIQETGPQSSKPRIKHLLNHSPLDSIGLLKDLKEDEYGLFYESKIGSHNLGRDFIKMVDSGLITEHSIGYIVTAKSKNPPEGVKREILEVKLYEGSSLTGWGVNEGTPLLSLKGIAAYGEDYKPLPDIDEDYIQQRIKALDKFCRSTDATDETIEILLLEIKQLSQLLLNLTTSSTPSAHTEAIEPPKGAEIKSLEYNQNEVLALIEIQRSRLKFN